MKYTMSILIGIIVGSNSIHADAALLQAVWDHDIKKAESLLENKNGESKKELANEADKQKITPLMYAAGDANLAMVRLLIKAGANLDACDRQGNTALFYAVRAVYKYLMHEQKQEDARGVWDALIEAGARQDIKNEDNITALQLSEKMRDHTQERAKRTLELIELLKNNPNDKENALHLINLGIDTREKDALGRTPLFYARSKDVINALLKTGIHIDESDGNGITALMDLAPIQDDWALQKAKILIELNAHIGIKDSQSETALNKARKAKNKEMQKLLENAAKTKNKKGK